MDLGERRRPLRRSIFARGRVARAASSARGRRRGASRRTRARCARAWPHVRAREEGADAGEDRRSGLAVELLVDDGLRERDEQTLRGGELHAERPDRVDEASERRSDAAQVLHRDERDRSRMRRRPRRGRLSGRRAFAPSIDRMRSFVATPPLGREAAGLAARGEHSMARNDDRERVSPERLPDRARRAGRADARGDLAVRERRTRPDRARRFVDAAMKRRHALHVERHRREIARLAAKERADARRSRAARAAEATPHARPGNAPRPSGASRRHRPRGDARTGRPARPTRCRTARSAVSKIANPCAVMIARERSIHEAPPTSSAPGSLPS